MHEKRLTDVEAKKLLARASELDAEHAHSLDIATVREIAAEAGISPAAMDAALQESVDRQQPAIARSSSVRRLLVVSRVALVLGAVYVLFVVVARLVT